MKLLPAFLTLAAGLGFAGCNSGSPAYHQGSTMYLAPGGAVVRGMPAANRSLRPGRQFDSSHWDAAAAAAGGRAKIVIDLSDQLATFYKGESVVGIANISSGDAEHATPTGTFRVTQKSPDHRSNMYGDFVDHLGNTIVRNIAASDKRPAGTHFEGSPMRYFLRFNGAIGMHAGYLPGYPASHGCVRLPEWMARNFYNHAPHGTPVIVQQ